MSVKRTSELLSNFNINDFFARSDLMRFDKYTDSSNPIITYYGIAQPGSLASQPVWFIWREVVNGNVTRLEHPALGDDFRYIWDNRDTYFTPAAFDNTFSVQFDGINDFIQVADSPNLNLNSGLPFTWSWWQKSTDGTAYTIIEKALSNQGLRIYKLGSDRIEVSWRGPGGTGDRIRVNTTAAPPGILDGTWHHYCLTFDGVNAAGMQLYEDGIPLAMTTLNDTLTGDPTNTAVLAIGSRSNGTDNFTGNIDEVSFWNSELSAAEVVEIYGGGSPQFPISQNQGAYVSSGNLVSWWRMGDTLGDVYPTILDPINGNDGLMTNMAAGDIESEAP